MAKLIEVIRHDDDGTYQFLVSGKTWFDGVTADKAMDRLVAITNECDCRAEEYDVKVWV